MTIKLESFGSILGTSGTFPSGKGLPISPISENQAEIENAKIPEKCLKVFSMCCEQDAIVKPSLKANTAVAA